VTQDAERQGQVPRQVSSDQPGDDGRRDGEVCDDNPAGPARQGDHGRDGGQVVAHDDGVGGVQGEEWWTRAVAVKLPGHGINDPGLLQPSRPMSAIGG